VVNFTPQLLYPQGRKQVLLEYEVVWFPELVWTFERREKSFAPAGI
jgi:hypothetical protein